MTKQTLKKRQKTKISLKKIFFVVVFVNGIGVTITLTKTKILFLLYF